ncbi:MAG: DMT family transporter [Firmicutes bacterium]|nr:DMT family transporter [Bacillota bacterium]
MLPLLLSLALTALNPVWLQLSLWQGGSPLALLFWQALFASFFFAVYVGIKNQTLFLTGKYTATRMLSLGAVGFFPMALLFGLGTQSLGAQMAVLLFFTYPLFVILGNTLFFRTSLGRFDLYALLALFAGVLVITNPGPGTNMNLAVLLPLGAALSYAFFILFSGYLLQKGSPLQTAMYAQFGFLLGALPLLFFLPPTVLMFSPAIFFALILAFLSSFAGFLLFLQAIAALGAKRVAVCSVINLPLSLLFTGLFLGERLSLALLPGLLLVMLGIILENRGAVRRRKISGGE